MQTNSPGFIVIIIFVTIIIIVVITIRHHKTAKVMTNHRHMECVLFVVSEEIVTCDNVAGVTASKPHHQRDTRNASLVKVFRRRKFCRPLTVK